MSFPLSATGIASRWILLGTFHFSSRQASHKVSMRPYNRNGKIKWDFRSDNQKTMHSPLPNLSTKPTLLRFYRDLMHRQRLMPPPLRRMIPFHSILNGFHFPNLTLFTFTVHGNQIEMFWLSTTHVVFITWFDMHPTTMLSKELLSVSVREVVVDLLDKTVWETREIQQNWTAPPNVW